MSKKSCGLGDLSYMKYVSLESWQPQHEKQEQIWLCHQFRHSSSSPNTVIYKSGESVACNRLKHCSLVFIKLQNTHILLVWSSGGNVRAAWRRQAFLTPNNKHNRKSARRNAGRRLLPAFGRWERSCWWDIIRDIQTNCDRSSSWESGRRKDNTLSFRSSQRSPYN